MHDLIAALAAGFVLGFTACFVLAYGGAVAHGLGRRRKT
jgi:hypothetical protein